MNRLQLLYGIDRSIFISEFSWTDVSVSGYIQRDIHIYFSALHRITSLSFHSSMLSFSFFSFPLH